MAKPRPESPFINLDAEVAARAVEFYGGPERAARELGLSRQTFWRIRHGDVARLSPKNEAKWETYVKSQIPPGQEGQTRPEWLMGDMTDADVRNLEAIRYEADFHGFSKKQRNGQILDYLFANGLDPADNEVYEVAFGYARGKG